MSDVMENPVRPNADGVSVPSVWNRVNLNDLSAHWPWLAARLHERWPGVSDREIFAHLVNCMSDNECWFVSNQHAIGLFRIDRQALEARYIQEVFCLSDNTETTDFAEDLYDPTGDWGRRQKIEVMRFMRFSDATSAHAAFVQAKGIERVNGKATPGMRLIPVSLE